MYHSARYTTFTEWYAEYKRHINEIRRQFNYERNIVRSVPQRSIHANSVLTENDERWKPG